MRFCLDTNVLFSFQKGIDLGSSPEEVAQCLTRAGSTKNVTFFMPPRIVEELRNLIEPKGLASLEELLTQVTVQSPTIHNQSVGTQILYDFVNESRLRTQQGIRIADEIVVQTAQEFLQKGPLSRIDLQKALQPIKENLRLRYRNATRTGFVDSVADLDLLFLCKETDSFLVSADEGVMIWGRKIGVKEMDLSVFGETIRKILA